MGRWAQARKRGGGPGGVSFQLDPPSGAQFIWHDDGDGNAAAEVPGSPAAAIYFEVQVCVGNVAGPALPWGNNQIGPTGDTLEYGPFDAVRVWAHCRWLNASQNPISAYSDPLYVDF